MRAIEIGILVLAAGCAQSASPPADRISLRPDVVTGFRRLEIVRPTGGIGLVFVLLPTPEPLVGSDREAAHHFEHLVLRTRVEGLSISEHFDRAGGSIHGRTSQRGVSFQGFVPQAQIERLAAVLAGAIAAPDLDPGEVEKERRILAIETGRPTLSGPAEVSAIHRRLVELRRPVVAILIDAPVTPGHSAAHGPADTRAIDPALLAADLAAAAETGELLDAIRAWPGSLVHHGEGAWTWTARPEEGPPAPLLEPAPASVSPREGPRLELRVPIRSDGAAERKALARDLYRELVLDRGIAYGPTVVLSGDEIVATIWTDQAGLEECAHLLRPRGQIRSHPSTGRR